MSPESSNRRIYAYYSLEQFELSGPARICTPDRSGSFRFQVFATHCPEKKMERRFINDAIILVPSDKINVSAGTRKRIE